jgi:hypothetical protein
MAETRGSTFVMQSEDEGSLTFSAFILGLASTTLIHLGVAAHPESGAIGVDLELARQSIDALNMLREKTRGNLDGDEERLFTSILTDLRMRFVEKSSTPR